ncbi:MAG: oxalurate catabolism protein HpxZ [Acetobacter sp.]|uniref:oxalurate catabolism protein HpxZ n=1 Tax=Acetobacter sp. TaxID=440 RepID=UPI0039ED83F2
MTFDDAQTLHDVTLCADAYEKALADNDLQALDAMFWDGPQTVRYGVGENLYGAAEIAAFRRARSGGSPPRTVLRRVVTPIGTDSAVVSLEFRRDGSTRTGRQMQTWVRTPQGWKILAAHVSLMAEQPETRRPAL